MKIEKITNQHRRDFSAVLVCHCGHTQKLSGGYDDDNFHRNVIPAIKCEACGQTAADSPTEFRPLATKYPPGMIV